jgi:uncharacterized protein (DUF2147 family)
MPLKCNILFCVLLVWGTGFTHAQNPKACEKICGKWESTDKEVEIKVYMVDNEFKAEIIGFSNTEGKPMDYWKDVHNPDPALRDRKILGMSVLSGLKYNAVTDMWEGGMVYDSQHGKDWNASATVDKKGMLRVRGYWHFKFIGHTMDFVRM